MDQRLRLAQAAGVLGVHPLTLRRYANEGRVPFVRVGQQRRFALSDLEAFLGVPAGQASSGPVPGALYVRVSGSTGQETALAGQEAELRAAAVGPVVAVFKDRASGLREKRPGLDRLLARAVRGEFAAVRVTHEDRLARFGAGWLRMLLADRGVRVEVLHAKGSAGGMPELLDDFMALVATFSGRMYGIRSREAKRRLLGQARERVADGDDDAAAAASGAPDPASDPGTPNEGAAQAPATLPVPGG